MGENLDLLVLGGWWGKGGRTGKISSLLCGLRVPQQDDGSGNTPEFASQVDAEILAEEVRQIFDVYQDWLWDEL